MKLTELLDQPYEFEVKRLHGAWFAEFETDGGSRVEVNLEGSQYGETEVDTVWSLEFIRDGDVLLTGGGDAARILSTVVKFVREFADKMVPPAVVYAAGKSEASRARVYRRLFERARPPEYVLLTAAELDTIKDPRLEIKIRRLIGNQTGSMEFFAMIHKDELNETD